MGVLPTPGPVLAAPASPGSSKQKSLNPSSASKLENCHEELCRPFRLAGASILGGQDGF